LRAVLESDSLLKQFVADLVGAVLEGGYEPEALGECVRATLDALAAVLVCEVACAVPGCPPLETVVAFWSVDDKRHQFKLFKPMLEIIYDDIGWLMGSPSDHDGSSWDCC